MAGVADPSKFSKVCRGVKRQTLIWAAREEETAPPYESPPRRRPVRCADSLAPAGALALAYMQYPTDSRGVGRLAGRLREMGYVRTSPADRPPYLPDIRPLSEGDLAFEAPTAGIAPYTWYSARLYRHPGGRVALGRSLAPIVARVRFTRPTGRALSIGTLEIEMGGRRYSP